MIGPRPQEERDSACSKYSRRSRSRTPALAGVRVKPERVPTCRSCGAEIRFLRAATGRPIPVDREPDADLGNGLIERGVATPITSTTQLVALRADGRDLYVSHFATCPRAHVHRRPAPTRAALEREGAGQGALFT